ncbi:MAG: DUF1080 domain-containing protein [Planctomycetes bacterium]|nr:DUF1080 domain-containing protein [Planctomycetota bacterium]
MSWRLAVVVALSFLVVGCEHKNNSGAGSSAGSAVGSSGGSTAAVADATPAPYPYPVKLTDAEIADGWLSLFDGATLYGWEPSAPADWKVADGAITVSSGEKSLLCTTSDFGDYVFKCDFKAVPATNSGIFLRTPLKPSDPAKDCYELNIAGPETSPFSNGSFVGRQKATKFIDSSDWRTYEVTAEGAHLVVKIDGETVLDYTDPAPLGRGRIGLQHNMGPVAFRNIKLKPLGLKSIFNGKDLAGWKNHPESKSVFVVNAAGEINVKNGRGQLESNAQFGDFIARWDCFSNGKHLNSGVFFRSIPGDLTNGYECQVQNGYKDGDRTKPVDCGTGGFYRRQDARAVLADDFQWFTQVLVVSGPHMACWVNGTQVSDWTDTRAPHDNPRNGLRLAKGTLILQGHDPTTDLNFRNLQAAELPPR